MPQAIIHGIASSMTPEQAVRDAKRGELLPVYLVLGEESYLADEVIAAITQGTDLGATKGFNHERFVASESNAESVLAAARTVPMMARYRLVVLSGLERWDKQGEGGLDLLAEYAANPVPSSVLVLSATKLHGSRKLVRHAKQAGYLVSCQTLARRDLPAWIRARAEERGHALDGDVTEALAELVGPELGPVADALDRLALYVGNGAPITHDALAA